MQETLSHVLVEVRSAWRFRWYGVIAAWVVCLGGWAFVALQPDVYEATASVYVDASSVLEPVLTDQIVTVDVATHLNYVREALLGREHLQSVAETNGLFPPNATAAQRDALLTHLRETIGLVTIPHSVPTEFGERPSGSSTINITYQHSKPETAVAVVQSLLDALVSDTAAAGVQSADTQEVFLRAEIKTVETELERIEQEIADFMSRNSDRLPGNSGSYFDQVQTQRGELLETRQQLRRAESERDFLRTQLNSESPMVAGTAAMPDLPPNSPDARIRDQRAECDTLLRRYTEKHRDVLACRESLAALIELRAAELRARGINDPDQELSQLSSNPVYQAVQIDLNAAELEVATLRADVGDREDRLKALQLLIEEVPEVEAELKTLNRDYENLQGTYNDLTHRLQRMLLSRNALQTDDVEFRELNAPQASFGPVAPPRLKLLVLVFFGGLAAAVGLAYALAQIRPVFGAKRMLRELTGLPVLGAVSYAGQARRFGTYTSMVPIAACLFVLGTAFVGVVAVEMVGPGWHIVRGD